MKNPFAKTIKSLPNLKTNELQGQLDDLSNQLDELSEENLQLHMSKSIIDSNGSEPISGQFGLVDEQYDKAMLQKLFMTETWFFITVNTIAKTISSLPFKLEKRKLIKQNVVHSNGEREDVYKETWIEASAEPEANIFNCPNDLQGSMDFWYLVVADLLSTGDAFIHPYKNTETSLESSEDRLREAIQRVRKTEVEALYRINSAVTEVVPSEDPEKIIDGYAIITGEATTFFDQDEIIHIKMPNPSNPLYGLAPVVAVMKKVLLDRYTDEHHMRFYKQGARLGGAIETTKKLTKEQIVRLTKTFESNFTGKRQHHKTLILPEGMKYNIIEQSPVDSALIEFSKTNKEPILSAYNVPPIKVGLLDGATFANALIQNKTYYVDTIMPLTKLIEQAINKSNSILKPTRNLRFSFDFSQIESLQEDYKAKADGAKAMVDSGMTVNEVREKMWGLPPLEGGDVTNAIQTAPINPLLTLSAPVGDQKVDTSNAQNDTDVNTDIVPTEASFEQRVGQLIAQAIAEGLDVGLATERAIAQALQEGFIPTILKPEDNDEEKAIGHTHMDSCGNKTGTAENKGEDGLHSHKLFDEEGKEIGDTSSDKDEARHTHTDMDGTTSGPRSGKFIPAPFSKESLQGYAKIVSEDGVVDLIDNRTKDYEAFMKRLKKFIISKIRKKAFKSGNTFKIKANLPSEDMLKTFIEKEAARVAESLTKATQHGYKANIPSRTLVFPNESADKILKKIATRNVTSVSKTTLKQLKNILTSSASEQVSVGELASRIQDAFSTITRSKAETIARTETLQAVSVGQDLKTRDFKSQFPKEAKELRRVWITARDAKVRDTHADLDGSNVKAGEEFDNGLKYPREPGSDASEVINCRCSFIDYLPEDQDNVFSILNGGQ